MHYLFAVLLAFSSLTVVAQPTLRADASQHRLPLRADASQPQPALFTPAAYPQDYFRNPLDVPISLAANFGELRPNHYHMGLDIRTQHRENLSVYAAAEGYVARVEIEPAGFGQAIYIRHPNGYTTVYGHLNRFFPALEAYVHEQQYRQQSWQVDLAIPPGLFPVKKGEFIAYSGSTGGSEGPHLHFEIRLTAGDINLNPLLFGLPVPDRTPPAILRLAWYDRNQGIYEQSPNILPARKMAASPATAGVTAAWAISPALLLVPTTRISFAISAFDAQSGSNNPNGIYQAALYENDRPVIGFEMNNISYDNTRNINAHVDYKTRKTGGPFLQQLSFLPGYPFPSIYRIAGTSGGVDPAAVSGGDDGVLDLSDGHRHKIRIDVSDTRGNVSVLKFEVEYRVPSTIVPASAIDRPAIGQQAGAQPANAQPASTQSQAPQPAKRFYPGMVDGLETTDCAFYLGEKSLYDSVTIGSTVAGYPGSGLSLPGGVSAVYTIGAPWIPLLDPVLVRLRPISPDSSTDRIVMVRTWGTQGTQGAQLDVRRPEWQQGWASARFREFGNFQLVEDTIAPVITPIGPLADADLSRAARIAIDVKDNLPGLHNFRAELDGAWLCFTNDKGLAFIYKFDEHCPPGRHTLKVTIEDAAGNQTTKEYHFTR